MDTVAASIGICGDSLLYDEGVRELGFFQRLKFDVASQFEEIIKRKLEMWGIQAITANKSCDKLLDNVWR